MLWYEPACFYKDVEGEKPFKWNHFPSKDKMIIKGSYTIP